MNVKILLSSGDVDTWTDVEDAVMEMDLMGALQVIDKNDNIIALYAPSMWMRLEREVIE